MDKRLGCGENGSQALRGHAFLATIDWPKLESKRSEPPFQADAAVQAMGPGSYGRQASKEDLKAFDEFAAYSRVDPRAKAELVGKLSEAATRGDCATRLHAIEATPARAPDSLPRHLRRSGDATGDCTTTALHYI